MQPVLLTAYLIIVLALIAVILLQRSEGGGLGMGSSSGGLIAVRGQANLLTRTTAILAALFFVLAIGLSILAEIEPGSDTLVQRAADSVGEGVQAVNPLDVLNQQSQGTATDLPVPGTAPSPTTTSAAPAGATPSATQTPAATADPGLAVPAAPAATPTASAPAR